MKESVRAWGLVVVLAGALAAWPAQADEATRWVRGTLVNLRAAPERNAAVLARLRLNTPVQLQGPETGEFCAVKPQRGHPAPGYVACALLAPRELAEAALADELKPWLEAYTVLLTQRNTEQKPTPLARRLLLDPREALALLERRFYLRPSIEALAWYGGLAEDIAYLGRQPDVDGPGSAPVAMRAEWLPGARTAWRSMISLLEQGWAADDPWPADGPYAYETADRAVRDDEPFRVWLVPVKPSLWRDDAELYALSGEPLTKRRLLRGATAPGADYVAEVSSQALPSDASATRSQAGGFRAVGPLLEFLKGQPRPPRLRFEQAGSYGIDGLLGTVAATLATPDGSVHLWALGRDGLSAASALVLTSRQVRCGAAEGVVVTLPAPRPALPLGFLATLKPLTPAQVKVTTLGRLKLAANAPGGDGAMRFDGWRFDLDGDGQSDLLVVQGRGKAELPTSGAYPSGAGGEDSLLNIIYANIGGVWKRVAYAGESGCT
jgi:hypothetical protein